MERFDGLDGSLPSQSAFYDPFDVNFDVRILDCLDIHFILVDFVKQDDRNFDKNKPNDSFRSISPPPPPPPPPLSTTSNSRNVEKESRPRSSSAPRTFLRKGRFVIVFVFSYQKSLL